MKLCVVLVLRGILNVIIIEETMKILTDLHLTIRDGRGLVCPGFSNAEINYIVKYLCTC